MKGMRYKTILAIIATLASLMLVGCAPKFKLFSGPGDPLKETTIQGDGDAKILLISLNGVISDSPKSGVLSSKASTVQEVVSRLRKAEKDDDIKAVILKINSPGGTVTASDVLYHELTSFRKKTKKIVVAQLMDVAASGGYYVALGADHIIAHPTTVTGSVGVIFMRPKLDGLMGKVGVGMEVSKSGRNKDMGSPFKPSTAEDRKLFDDMVADMAARFHSLVQTRRNLSPEALSTVKTARVFTADTAKELRLVDSLGYMDDGINMAKKLADIPDATIIAYRRSTYSNDTVYNSMDSARPGSLLPAAATALMPPAAGFYYLWTAGAR